MYIWLNFIIFEVLYLTSVKYGLLVPVPNTGAFKLGDVNVLLVSVSVPVKETKSSPCIAVLNSVSVPERVLESKSIDLLVNVSVVALPTNVSVAFGIVTVLSAVGSTTVKVVSYSFEVAPSNFKLF